MRFYFALYRRSMIILVPSLLVVAKWVPYSLMNRWNSRTYIGRVCQLLLLLTSTSSFTWAGLLVFSFHAITYLQCNFFTRGHIWLYFIPFGTYMTVLHSAWPKLIWLQYASPHWTDPPRQTLLYFILHHSLPILTLLHLLPPPPPQQTWPMLHPTWPDLTMPFPIWPEWTMLFPAWPDLVRLYIPPDPIWQCFSPPHPIC